MAEKLSERMRRLCDRFEFAPFASAVAVCSALKAWVDETQALEAERDRAVQMLAERDWLHQQCDELRTDDPAEPKEPNVGLPSATFLYKLKRLLGKYGTGRTRRRYRRHRRR